jgi:hypothetical protein
VTSVLLVAPIGVMAQQSVVGQTCSADIQHHCAGVRPGEGRIRACVREHFPAFSEPCKQALLSNVAVVKICKEDVTRTCPGIEPGGGRIQACMKEHFAEYSDRCKQAIVTAKLGQR